MPDLRPRLFRPPKGSYFLFGPRGSGKSTWLRQLHPDAHWVDLLDEGRFQSYLVEPSLFSSELDALADRSTVVIDEIQRLPNLLNVVHQKIEAKRLRFALSVSSGRKLRRAGVNLLAGRAVLRHLHPYVPEELGAEFDLRQVLDTGALPIVRAAEAPRDALTSYVQLYLREEIQAEAATRNLAGFARFLPLAGLFHGQILNVSSLARDAGVARTTVQGYLQILDETLFTFPLPAFEGRLRVREKRHPKLYWVDPGLVRAVTRTLDAPGAEANGALFEGWIAQCLRAYDDYSGLYDDIAYWAPADAQQTEVDFLLRRGRRYVAIEAKAARRWRPESSPVSSDGSWSIKVRRHFDPSPVSKSCRSRGSSQRSRRDCKERGCQFPVVSCRNQSSACSSSASPFDGAQGERVSPYPAPRPQLAIRALKWPRAAKRWLKPSS